VLITEQETGGGGSQFQFIFFGQNEFKQITDTIRFNVADNTTDFEERELFIKYLKLGLTPYLVKTGSARDIVIDMKKENDGKKADNKTASTATKDPWNYWVYRAGVEGSYRADENYKSINAYGEVSANRVTEELKTAFEISGGKTKETYYGEDSLGNETITITDNHNYGFDHYLIKSISERWSYGYEVIFSRNTFSNLKNRTSLETGIEYAIFPYKLVNTKFFTIAYTVDVRRNTYFDTTLYDKTKETLFGQSLESKISYKQKWGSLYFGLQYHNYLHNWKYFLLSGNVELDVRITGGLSFNVNAYAELTRDQLLLPKEGASLEDILIRRRQLASGYSFRVNFGINYRFGSKLNNFVNPRFD